MGDLESVFLDLDGTLTDPKEGITRCIQYALTGLGVAVPEQDELTGCIGPPLIESLALLVGDANAEAALSLYRERFAVTGLYVNSVYPGVPDLLRRLRAANLRLFVATSKPQVYAERILQYFNLAPTLDAVFGSELDGSRIHKEELLAYALQRTGAEASASIMVGDRKHDLLGARANGMDAVAVLYGYGTREELESAGARRWAATVEEIGDIIP